MTIAWIDKHLDVQTDNPDQQRRGRLLNILLFGFLIISIVTLILGIALLLFAENSLVDSSNIIYWGSILVGGTLVVGLINNYYSTTVASTIFLVFISVILFLSELPFESVWLNSSSLMIIPIVIASMILRPWTSFLVAIIISAIIVFGAQAKEISPNLVAIPAYIGVAFISWLTAHSLENTLEELRVLNAELDARVIKRTRQLQLSNEQLTIARDRALAASKFKSELTARVSHELRTPLGSILGYSEMLRAGYYGPVTEKQTEPLNKIIETDKELTNLINNLLDQAKLESGKLHLEYTIFPVSNLLTYVKDLMQVLADEKGLELICIVEDSLPRNMYGDEMRLQQILINLVGNAIKFTDHGRVLVMLQLFDQTHWMIKVEDSGNGIPKHMQPYVFDSFQQIDGSASRKHAGSGLGLSIVKQLVDLMDGEILLQSEVGAGATFKVVLPLIKEQEEQIYEQSASNNY